ncbi:MAG: metallophosphoesterase [Methylobacter sp.]|nr:metallophosphoesterase [Methylobacter sp.]
MAELSQLVLSHIGVFFKCLRNIQLQNKYLTSQGYKMFELKIKSVKKQAMLAASLSLVAAIYSAPSIAVVADPVVLTFSTVGDSRQDPQNIDPSSVKAAQVGVGNCQIPSGATGLTANPGLSGQDCKWLQNTTAWSRIMRTIQAQKAQLLFFNGDMIMGYGKAGVPVTRNSLNTAAAANAEAAITSPIISDVLNSDAMQIYKQYGFWRGMVANLMETGTYVVPVPGNHETQCKRCGKTAQVENENAWRDNMGDLILDTARFTSLVGTAPTNFANSSGSADSLATNQSQLSYSFDVGTSHFAIINTDAVGSDGHAPTVWLESDLTAAQARGATRNFVFGHKSAYFYAYTGSAPSSTSSLNDKDSVAAAAFWTTINNHKATYFCGHEHIYNVSKPSLLNSYQVLVGAGGSPFETSTATSVVNDRMYSWATVKVFQSGNVQMDTWGFDPTLTNPIVKLETVQLTHF